MAARQELHSGLSEMATQTQNYKLHKFELKDAPADITAINASMDIIDTQLKALADGKFDKTGGTISGNLVVNGSTTLKKLTASELDLNGNADVSGTLKVAGATTLTGALAANGGVTTTTIKATGTSTLAAVNATNISASGTLNVTGTTTLTGKLTANGGLTTKALTATSLDLNGNGDVSGSLTVHGDLNAPGSLNVSDITATGSTTLVNLNAANITATGTLKVNGAATLTGLLAANGGVTTKKVTATELDLNGNADVSGTLTVHGATTLEAVQAKGNLTVGGLLNVTGTINANRLIQEGSNPLAIRIPETEKGVTPAESHSNGIDFFDAEGVVGGTDRLGLLRVQYSNSGSTSFSIGATQPTAGSTLNSEIKVGWRLNGSSYERYTEAPTPPSGDESTQIATTDFVNALIDKYGLGMRIGRSGCGYINDANEVPGSGFYSVAASSANVPVSTTCLLHVQRWVDNGSSGFQLIPSATGKRMFLRIKGGSQGWGDWLPLVTQDWEYDFSAIEVVTKRSADTVRLLAQNLSVTKGTHPTAGKYWDFRACDSEGRNVANSLGGMSVAYASDGAVSTRIIAYKPEHGSSTGASIIVGYNAEGQIVTSAPTPVTGSNDNSIATTAFVMAAAGTMTLKATRTSAGSFTVTGLKVNQLVMVQCELRNDTWDGGDYSRIASDNTTSPSSLQTGANTGGYSLFMVALAETVTFTVTNNGISSATWKVYVL